MNLLDASCAGKKTLVGGADEWALEPTTPRVHEAACPIVSLRLCDPIEGVADRASHPLNRQIAWSLCTYQASDAWKVAHGLGHRFAI